MARKSLVVLPIITLILALMAACVPLSSHQIGDDDAVWDICIEAGVFTSFVILCDGRLLGWGRNQLGQLGDGTTIDRIYPVWIMDDVIAVSAGGGLTMAIKADGSLWAWGYNRNGQLGDGTKTDRHYPVQIKNDAMAVSVSSQSSFVITTDGLLWGIGLGNDSVQQQEHILIVDNVSYVSVGGGHVMVIKTDNSLWGWGFNNTGQLGDGTTEDRNTPVWIMDDVAYVSTGASHTMAIKKDGSLWGWGGGQPRAHMYESFGQVGSGTQAPQLYPTLILDDVVKVSAGPFYTMAIKIDNSLWGWGHSDSGRLGFGESQSGLFAGHNSIVASPEKIMDSVAAISTGSNHVIATMTDGRILAWGSNMDGQLGDGTTRRRNQPVNLTNNILSALPQ